MIGRIFLSAVGAVALIAGATSVAQAESFGGGVGFYPNGRVAGVNLNFSTGNRGGYGGGYGGYPYGRGAPVYGVPVIVQQPVVIQRATPVQTFIVTEPCIAGFVPINGQCVRVRRIR